MTPLRFEPLLKRIRWGGRQLGELLGKNIGLEADYAESWELADHGEDQTIVSTGPLTGRSLQQLMQQNNHALLGRHAGLTQFPLLIKYLDANDWLSLQVHPNDQQARQYDSTENGKTEAWIILDAQPDSEICAGLKPEVDQDSLARHLRNGTIEECLHKFPVAVGDCVFVPAGTVHAIGPGIVLAEIQQQSNLTFRLYDWGRLGSDGRPREIHITESLACTDFERGPVTPVSPQVLADGDHRHEELVRDPYFVIHRHRTTRPFQLAIDNQFHIVMVLDGSLTVETSEDRQTLSRGSTLLLPAASADAMVTPDDEATCLDVFLP